MSEQEAQQETFLEEEQIFFKRFPAEKQEQVRGLVQYATLMGLTGKDLVSIGGKLDRLKESAERARNVEIVESFDCLLIGTDAKLPKHRQRYATEERFKLKYPHGAYNFKYDGPDWKIHSLKTGVIKSHRISYYSDDYALPKSYSWGKRRVCCMLLDIYNGKFTCNF